MLARQHVLGGDPLEAHSPHLFPCLRFCHLVQGLDRDAGVFLPVFNQVHASAAADRILFARGIPVLPDVLAQKQRTNGAPGDALDPVDLRTAALVEAVGRVAGVAKKRGIWP